VDDVGLQPDQEQCSDARANHGPIHRASPQGRKSLKEYFHTAGSPY
jgi:hypothetical protein